MQRETGTAFLYVTHDQHEALSMSDHIVVMNSGRIEQSGTPSEIFERPATRFVATFMGARNVLDAVVVPSSGARMVLHVAGNTIAPPNCDPEPHGTIVLVIRPERVGLAGRDDETGDPERVHWPGVIRDRVYSGSSFVYEITLIDGTSLVAEIPARDRSPVFSSGEPVNALIDPADVVLIDP